MGLFADTDNEDIRNLLNNIIRIGKVSSICPEKATARVFFRDDGYYDATGKYKKLVTYELLVLQRNTLKNKDYAMPDVGEDVLCVFLPFGLASGFVLGSVYAGENTPPESTENKRTVIFDDDTKVTYDRATHQFDIQIKQTAITANRDSVKVKTPVFVDVTTDGNVIVNAADSVAITGAAAVSVTAPAITLDGNVQVNGTLTATTDVIADRISLANHAHRDAPTSTPIKPQ